MAATILAFPNALSVATGRPVDEFDLLPEFAREEAERRLAVIRPVLANVERGCSINAAAKLAASMLGPLDSESPSEQTLARWIKSYRAGGLLALAPSYKGRARRDYGWEARALELYNTPSRPAYATVALWLRQEGHASADYHLVRAYLKSAPSNLAETGRKRLGAHYYAQNIRPHIVRDATVLPVGAVYQGDGHTCDVYVAAPATGNPYRPELTVWLDVRSHYVVGWWLSESESAITTLFSFSNALLAQDHVPALVHTDPGSGFTARVIADAETGFFDRFSIQIIEGLPANARGHGLVEGFWRWFEERCGKRFTATYCGDCRTDGELRMLSTKARRGDVRLPTLQEYTAAIRDYFAFYNDNPQESLGNRSPADLWATLDKVGVETPAVAVVRPRTKRTVRKWGIELHNRTYRAAELAQFETRQVVVEYDLHDDSYVRILDAKGRHVCDAMLVEKAPWLPQSRIEEAQAKRLEGQQKRLQIKLDEAAARARPMVDAPIDDRAREILAHLETMPTLPAPEPVAPRALSSEDEIERRFGRAQALQARIDAGEPVDPEEAAWLARYRETAEYRGQARFLSFIEPSPEPGSNPLSGPLNGPFDEE